MLPVDILINHLLPAIPGPFPLLLKDRELNKSLETAYIYKECIAFRLVNKDFCKAVTELKRRVSVIDWKKVNIEITEPWKLNALKLYFANILLSDWPLANMQVGKQVFEILDKSIQGKMTDQDFTWFKILISVSRSHNLNTLNEQFSNYNKFMYSYTPILYISQALGNSTIKFRQTFETLFEILLNAEPDPKGALYREYEINRTSSIVKYLNIRAITSSTLQILIKHGLNVNDFDKKNQGTLLDSMFSEYLECASWNYEKSWCNYEDKLEKIKILIENGAVVSDYKEYINKASQVKNTDALVQLLKSYIKE